MGMSMGIRLGTERSTGMRIYARMHSCTHLRCTVPSVAGLVSEILPFFGDDIIAVSASVYSETEIKSVLNCDKL